MGNEARYYLDGYLMNDNNKYLVKELIGEFKQAIESANQTYAEEVVDEYKKRKQQEIARRQAEIQRLESENKINEFLKDLL